jgi:hypothetical protein
LTFRRNALPLLSASGRTHLLLPVSVPLRQFGMSSFFRINDIVFDLNTGNSNFALTPRILCFSQVLVFMGLE